MEDEAIVVFLDSLANLVEEIDRYPQPIIGLTTESFLNRLQDRIALRLREQQAGEDTGIQANHMWNLLQDAVRVYQAKLP